MIVDDRDITILYQGDIKDNAAYNILLTKKTFPKSKFVLSTFNDIDNIASISKYFDEVIISEPHPDKIYRGTEHMTVPDNTNNMIISTREGLKKIKTKYTFKLRTDVGVMSKDFLTMWDRFPRHCNDYKLFEHKIMIPEAFTRNPYKHYVYHPSDLIFFGLTSDLLDYFDIPYVVKKANVEKIIAGVNGLCPEQHMFISYLNKKGRDTGTFPNRFLRPTESNKEDTDKYFVSNFIILSWQQFGTTIPPKFNTDRCRLRMRSTCYSNISWTKKYKELTKNA